jgi:dTMP kinase
VAKKEADMKGKFITLEGCEGVGKSTQLNMLKEYLERTNQDAFFTREPGGTPVAEAIRQILLDQTLVIEPKVEAMLFATARISHIDEVIIPNLEKGKIVVSDRYVDSSLAYQGFARNLGLEYVQTVNKYAFDVCMPDCTIFIDMDPEFSWRKQKGNKVFNDRLENEKLEFHKGCYFGFKELARVFPERIVKIVPDIDKAETHRRIVEALKSKGVIK